MFHKETYTLLANVVLWYHLKEAQNLFLGPLPWLFPAGRMTCPTQPELLSP